MISVVGAIAILTTIDGNTTVATIAVVGNACTVTFDALFIRTTHVATRTAVC
jgi:hypothetical protein